MDIVQACIEDLISKIELGMGDVNGKTVYVYDMDVLTSIGPEYTPPLVGVSYSAMTPVNMETNDLSVTIQFLVVLIYGERDTERRGKEDKGIMTGWLKDVRDSVKLTVAPTGNKWRFGGESPFDIGASALAYAQRWITKGAISEK